MGVVCEGAHDYVLLKGLIEAQLAGKPGPVVVESVQPQIDATSMQIGGGGWTVVTEWLKNHSGDQWDVFFDQPLFATSPTYDAIVVHLDGDVLELSRQFNKTLRRQAQSSVGRRVSVLENWIVQLLNPSARNKLNLVAAIPVLHSEAWILAGLQANPGNVEGARCKGRAKRLLSRRYAGNAVKRVIDATAALAAVLPTIRQRAQSYSIFYNKVAARFP